MLAKNNRLTPLVGSTCTALFFLATSCGNAQPKSAPPTPAHLPSPAPAPVAETPPAAQVPVQPSPLMAVDMLKSSPLKDDKNLYIRAGGVNPDKAFPPNGQLFRKWGARVTRKDGGKVDPKIVRDACIAWIRNLVPNATEKSELGTDGEVIRLKYTAPGIEGTAVVLLHSQEPAEEVRYDLEATEFKQ